MADIIRMTDSRSFVAYSFPSTGSTSSDTDPGATKAQDVSGAQTQEMIDKIYKDAFESGEKKGYEAGFEKGEKEGYGSGLLQGVKESTEEHKKELSITFSALNSALQQSEERALTMKEDIKNVSIAVITEISQKVVNEELSLNPEIIVHWIEDCIASLPEQPSTVTIVLNDQDYQRIAKLDSLPDSNWKLKSNSLIKAGCCEVNTNLVDIKINPQEKINTMIEQIE